MLQNEKAAKFRVALKISLYSSSLGFLNNLSRLLINAQRHKFGMTQSVCFGPLQKFNHGYEFRADPDAFLHLFLVQDFAPPGASSFRKIHEWAFVGDERLQLLINHSASCWHKSIAHPGDVDQILSAVVADDD